MFSRLNTMLHGTLQLLKEFDVILRLLRFSNFGIRTFVHDGIWANLDIKLIVRPKNGIMRI